MIPIMPPDLALLSTLTGSNYPCLKLILMVPKVFEPLKFYCKYFSIPKRNKFMSAIITINREQLDIYICKTNCKMFHSATVMVGQELYSALIVSL